MLVFRVAVCVTVAAISTFGLSAATVEPLGPDGQPLRFAVDAPGLDPVPVSAWDPASPQKLVRIDGVLYQEDAGFFYRVQNDVITVRLADGVSSWDELVELAGASSTTLAAQLLSLDVVRRNRLGIVDLVLPEGDPAEWAARVHETGLVRYAEVTSLGVWLDVPPNDPQYAQQWALNNTGQTGGTPGADVDAEAAWAISSGSPDVVVAVLDSGTQVGHPDLADNVWINEGEIPGNGQDDDANGFVDDSVGWDFGNNNNDPNTSYFHGTHVTGIVNAVGDNGLGVTGLAGGVDGPGVRSMALAVGEFGPIGSVLDDAILYAADNGAHVITLSLSVGSSQAINDALDYAYGTQDLFIDCAAGNGGSSVSYPANQAPVMAVASTDHNDNKSGFSNPGPQVEVAAPGSDILSTQLGNGYGISSGTSFAAPYVAGLAGLIRSVNPGLSAPEVRQLIIDTVDDVAAPGFDNGTGWGRINAFQALSQTGSSDGTIELDAAIYTCESSLTITVADFDLADLGLTQIVVRSQTEPQGETLVLTENTFGVFGGTLALEQGDAATDGVLQVAHQDTVTAEYVDADNGQGGSDVLKSVSAATDCAGPLIFGLAVSGTDRSATISWSTDEAGTSVVTYGESAPPDQQSTSTGLVTVHSIELNDLSQCTSYVFELGSEDALGNATSDDNGGMYYGFQTLGDFPGVGLVPCQQGQVQLDRTRYGCEDTLNVLLTDFDLNADPSSLDTGQVLLTSSSEPQGEWFDLQEIEVDIGAFSGTVDLAQAAVSGDGLLGASPGDLITVTYYDADDGAGSAQTLTFTAVADCVAPSIQQVRASSISASRALIEWSTDEPSTSRVEFGPDASLGSVVEDLELKTAHRLAVSAFDACERVLFRVSSEDAQGELRVADAGGEPFAFNLNQIGGLVFQDNFEGDTGWDLDGEWERATPQGLSQDPASAWSGSAVLGTDLSGTGNFLGDYEPVTEQWAFSDFFSTAGASNLELIVRRKLGVNSADTARIGVRNPFLTPVWASAASVNDEEWVEFRLDISAAADDRSAIQIGFGIDSTFPGHAYGWNIDELIVKDATQPDYLSCGGCSGAPAFAGVRRVSDPDPCGVSGLTLEWDPVAAWGTGSSGTYEVHRGSSPEFEPSPANRVAEGLDATVWTDTEAPVDTQVWYVVRARSDEDCAGQGLADANLVRLPGIETLAQPLPEAVGETVLATSVGDAHLRLDWAASLAADHYIVRRATLPDFSDAVEVGTTSGSFFEDVNAVSDGQPFYAYRVFAVNACGQEAP